MNEELKTIDTYSALSKMELSNKEQEEIWRNVKRRINAMPHKTPRRRSRVFGTSVAAVAAVAIVAGGFYAYSSHGFTAPTNKPGPTVASHDTTSNVPVRFPSVKDIQSLEILTGPTMDPWTAQDTKSVSTQVLTWLNSSSRYTGNIPKSTNSIIPQAYTGPAQLKMTTANATIMVYPVYYLAQTGTNAVQTRYVPNVVIYQTGNNTFYLKSHPLYSWLKDGGWKAEFRFGQPTQSFDFSKYLPFTPLLPSYTAGYQLTRSGITRQLNTGQNGNAISYSASYGNAFTIAEGRPNELHLASTLGPTTDVTLDNDVHATMQTHDGGESIEFTQNGLLIDVTTTHGGVSLQELEKVCTSIGLPAFQQPNVINMSDNGPQSANELSFSPIKAGEFYVPNGFILNIQGSGVDVIDGSKLEQFQITYRKGPSYLTVRQTTGSKPDYTKNGNYHNVTIHGVSVMVQYNNSSEPMAIFTIPQTQIHVVLYSTIASSEVTKVINSFLGAAVNNTSK